MFTVTQQNFSGPMEKLLELIEEKKLDITSISLAEVTADFISFARELKRVHEETMQTNSEVRLAQTEAELRNAGNREFARLVSDFLVVAAQLLFIKSRALLPQVIIGNDEDEGIFDLERQLRVYSSMKPLFAELKKFWIQTDSSYSRDYLKTVQPVFYPPSGITSEHMLGAFERATATAATLVREEQTIERHVVTLEEKISELSESVLEGSRRFSSLAGERTKHEVIVMFLALLHLLRDRLVHAKQADLFGEIEFQRSSEQT